MEPFLIHGAGILAKELECSTFIWVDDKVAVEHQEPCEPDGDLKYNPERNTEASSRIQYEGEEENRRDSQPVDGYSNKAVYGAFLDISEHNFI